jgi:ABC-type branched-subunit amino acid transport system substrate-binding protein
MTSRRDKLLAGLFALQLVAAGAFGVALVHGLGDSKPQRLVTAAPGSAPVAAASAGPVASGSTGGTAGTSGTAARTTTTTSGGSGSGGASSTGGGTASSSVVAKGAPIKVGAIVTQTGAINFVASAQGTKAYLDRVNAKGGVNGHKIVLDLRDDQLDAARGKAQARQLLSEGVFTFAAWQAPLTEGDIVPFLEQNKMPLIGSYGVGQEYHSEYAYSWQSHHYGYEMGRFLALEPKVTHPGAIFISGNAAANDAQVRALQAGVAAGGKKLASGDIVQVDVTKASYDDVVTQFKLAGVDGIATIIDQTAYNRLQQAMDRQSYAPVHVADPLFTDPTVTQKPTTEGTLVASDFELPESDSAQVADYVQTVRKQFGSRAQISYLGVAGWFSAKVLVDALTRMGNDISRANLLKTMDSLPSNLGAGYTSALHFAPGAHDINQCLKLGKVSGGKVTPYKDWACDTKSFDK